MFEVLVLFTSLLTGRVEEYTSNIKFDTEEHCKAQEAIFNFIVDKRLYKLDKEKDPYKFKMKCEFFYTA